MFRRINLANVKNRLLDSPETEERTVESSGRNRCGPEPVARLVDQKSPNSTENRCSANRFSLAVSRL